MSPQTEVIARLEAASKRYGPVLALAERQRTRKVD